MTIFALMMLERAEKKMEKMLFNTFVALRLLVNDVYELLKLLQHT